MDIGTQFSHVAGGIYLIRALQFLAPVAESIIGSLGTLNNFPGGITLGVEYVATATDQRYGWFFSITPHVGLSGSYLYY